MPVFIGLRWWMEMPDASLFVSSHGLEGRGGRGAEDDKWCFTFLALYRYLFPSRAVMRESPHDHEIHLLLLPPPSSSLLIHLCRHWNPRVPPPRSCCDLLMAVWVKKQRSNSRTRALSVRDDEEGHLICRSGDVLQERCTHCHYSIVTLLHMSITA